MLNAADRHQQGIDREGYCRLLLRIIRRLQLAQKMSEGMHYVVKFLWHTTAPRRHPRIAFAYPADS